MPLVNEPKHIYEPNPLACGQAVLAMLSGEDVENVISLVGTDRETKLRDMFSALEHYGIDYSRERREAKEKSDLAEICILSLETPKCWHWSLYFKGTFYDPEYGVLSDFPPSSRRYYFEIKERRTRKPNRMKGFDYSSNGKYFITICTKEKIKILCSIVGDGVLDVPKIHLTDKGRIVEQYIKSINRVDGVFVEKYVIMPNHIHLILVLEDQNGTSRTPSPTNAKIPHIISTFKRFCNKAVGENIFQRSFHDHVIRNEDDYQKIYEYIESNPAKWQEDEYYQNPEDSGF